MVRPKNSIKFARGVMLYMKFVLDALWMKSLFCKRENLEMQRRKIVGIITRTTDFSTVKRNKLVC